MDFDAGGNAMQRLALIALASVTCLMSEARATPPDLPVPIATDLSFIEKQVSKTLTLLGVPPTSGYPNIRSREATAERGRRLVLRAKPGMDERVFPGAALALYQATGSKKSLDAAQAWTAPLASQAMSHPVDPTDVGFIIGTSFGNGYRLTGVPAYKDVLMTAGGSLAVPSLYNSTVGRFAPDFRSIPTSVPLCRDRRQYDDPWAVAVGAAMAAIPLGRELRRRTLRR